MLFSSYLLTLFQNKSSYRTWFALKLMRRRNTFSCEWFCTKTHFNTKTKGAIKQPSIPMEGQWKFQGGGPQSWKQEISNKNIKCNWNTLLLWVRHGYFLQKTHSMQLENGLRRVNYQFWKRWFTNVYTSLGCWIEHISRRFVVNAPMKSWVPSESQSKHAIWKTIFHRLIEYCSVTVVNKRQFDDWTHND